ncbi:MAG: DUF2066 domain-containing protein [Rhodospirillales bacterium]|nr:DUF2066 domain-containing protein [Rhodospirillales bacterium]
MAFSSATMGLARIAALTLVASTLGLPPPAHAQAPPRNPALYQATAIVTGTDMRQRPLGFGLCLTEVLVKLSGRPQLRDNPAVAALASHADALVETFAYVDPRAALLHHDDQGTYDRSYELTVHFDPAKADAALATLGVAPWTGPRPVLTPVILVRNRDPDPFLLSAETPRGAEMRAALVRVASEYGVGVHFPTDAELAAGGVDVIGYPDPLDPPGPGQMRIRGTLSFSLKAMGWVGTWRARRDGTEHEWRISGVGYDAAFADLVRGGVELAAGTGNP